jgi:hypothetical protein
MFSKENYKNRLILRMKKLEVNPRNDAIVKKLKRQIRNLEK